MSEEVRASLLKSQNMADYVNIEEVDWRKHQNCNGGLNGCTTESLVLKYRIL